MKKKIALSFAICASVIGCAAMLLSNNNQKQIVNNDMVIIE